MLTCFPRAASSGLRSLGWGRGYIQQPKGEEGRVAKSPWQDSECSLRKERERWQEDAVGWYISAALCKAAVQMSDMNSKDRS